MVICPSELHFLHPIKCTPVRMQSRKSYKPAIKVETFSSLVVRSPSGSARAMERVQKTKSLQLCSSIVDKLSRKITSLA